MMHAISRFEAMPRLLDEHELEELASQPGFDATLVRKLRRERRRTYSLYLTEVSAEFHSLAKEALYRGANDPNIDPGFVGSVLKVRLRFTLSLWMLRASLYLPAKTRPDARQMTINLLGSFKPMLTLAS